MPQLPIDTEERCHRFVHEEVKEIAIFQHYTLGYNVQMIARNLRMSKRTVERTLHLWRTTGEVDTEATQKKQKRRRILGETEQEVSNDMP